MVDVSNEPEAGRQEIGTNVVYLHPLSGLDGVEGSSYAISSSPFPATVAPTAAQPAPARHARRDDAKVLRQLRRVLDPDNHFRSEVASGMPWRRVAISGVPSPILALAAYIEIQRKLPTLPRALEAFRDDILRLADLPRTDQVNDPTSQHDDFCGIPF